MTHASIQHSHPSRRARRLFLAGNARHQEANRKDLLRALQRFERESIRDAKRAARVAAALSKLNVDAIAANRAATKYLLSKVVRFSDGVRSHLRCLLGISYEDIRAAEARTGRDEIWLLWMHIDGNIDLRSTSMPEQTPSPIREMVALTADSVLAEATKIIAQASDRDIDDIDWSENPKSERERALRQAIIARIELEGMTGPVPSPFAVKNALNDLTDADVVGEDLHEALERWRERCAEMREAERRRLLDRARRDIDGEV